MIRVTMNVIGHASEFFPGKATCLAVELPEPMAVLAILQRIGVKPEMVMRVVAGGRSHGKDYCPADGEEITLISPPSGG